VLQQLRERLLVGRDGGPPRIALYSGSGPLKSWVRVAALRAAASVRRQRKEHLPLGGPDVPADLPAQDPELQILRGRYGAALPAALRDAFAALESRDRALLRMHFLDGLNLERLGIAFQVSRATAGRMLLAARTRLLDGTLGLLGDRLGLRPEEVQSLVGVLRSKLEVSLRVILREP
jgi:RNA polymerase sigma-70 factor (ECF subfamily)